MTDGFKRGDKVIDGGGYKGVIVQVTNWHGSRWYDVRFVDDDGYSPGVAVRYDRDLRLIEDRANG